MLKAEESKARLATFLSASECSKKRRLLRDANVH
jgi:hypothetical protein